jgi:Short repeat of unknown function (DUF308)
MTAGKPSFLGADVCKMGLALGQAGPLKRSDDNRNLKTSLVGSSDKGYRCNCFGIIAFVYAGLTVATLVLFFGAWVLIDGIFRVVGALGHRAEDPDWG